MARQHRSLRFYGQVVKESMARFIDEDAPTHSAALAYAMVFSLPPMLLIIFWTAGRLYKEFAVQEAIFSEIGELVGTEGARQLTVTVERLDVQEPTWWATAVAIGAVLFTATTVLSTLQNALNRIFRVDREGSAASSIWRMLRDRILSVAMIVTVSFLLTVSFVVEAFLATLGRFLAEWIGEAATPMVALDSFLLEFLATTLLFMLVFRVVPDVTLEWRDVRFGALLTAILFVAGKNLIASIIGQSNAADLYDAAGSILVLMLWVYYASALVLFGAIFTFTRARALGRARGGKGDGA